MPPRTRPGGFTRLRKIGDYRALIGGSPSLYGGGGGSVGSLYVDRLPDVHHDYVAGLLGLAYAFDNTHAVALTPDASYMVIGLPTDLSGGGGVFGTVVKSGIVRVFKRAGDGTYSEVATLTRPTGGGDSDCSPGWGSVVDINANLDIFVGSTQAGMDVITPFSGSNARIFTSTGIDTWDSGVNLGFSGCRFAHFAKWPAAGDWSTKKVLVVHEGWSGSSAITDVDRLHVWVDSGGGWTDTQTIALNDQGGPFDFVANVAITYEGRFIAAYYSTFNSGNYGSWIELWESNDAITWSSAQSFQVAATDGSGGAPLTPNTDDCIAISGDARVIVVANSNGIERPGVSFYDGLYVFQAPGTAFRPVVGPYAQTALLFGDADDAAHLGPVALSFDGQFAVVGLPFYPGTPAYIGAVYGVNRIQALSGESLLSGLANAYRFTNPFPSSQYNWGSCVAMDFNGRTVAAGIGNGISGTPSTEVRVLENSLDDLIGGITNDDWANAINITPTTPIANALLAPVKIVAANMEPGETLSSSSNRSPSLWWKITPAANRTFDVDCLLSITPVDPFYAAVPNIDTTIGIYTGASVDALTEIAFNDDGGTPSAPDEFLSALTGVALTSGVTYYIRVQMYGISMVDAPLLRLRYSIS